MIEEYNQALKAAEKDYKACISAHEYPFIPALDEIQPAIDTLPHIPLGLLEIPTDLIVGTKTTARQNSFARNFMPLLGPASEFAAKWDSLYRAQLDEGFHSPIKVIEYLHRFYVIEGNKRVSVSKFLDMPTIMADVTRVLPMDPAIDPAYFEFLDFYKVAPIYDIVCTTPGSYREIASLLGRDLIDPWPEDLVRALQSSFWHFSKVTNALRGQLPDMALGDAFLIYLRIYIHDALSSQPSSEITRRIKRISKELYTTTNKEKVSLVESSQDALNAGGLLTHIIPKLSYSASRPLKVAFMYDKAISESSWIYNHEAGRIRLERSYGDVVKTVKYEKCGTGDDFLAEIDRAVASGADVVISTSPRMMPSTLRAAIKYDKVKFLNCSINLANQAVRTYYAKLYEAKFLAGVVAAIESDNHMIGYCSDYPIYGTIAGINAFAIGAAMIDPDAKIYLEWSSKQDSDWLRSMTERGIRVISAVDSTHPADGSSYYGVLRINEDGSVTNLATPIWKWGRIYEALIRTILDGTYNAKVIDKKDQATNYWWGMTSGAVDIKLSESLSPYTSRMVSVLRSAILYHGFNPFDCELRSQTGIIRSAGDPLLTSMDIITMNWLNENIIGEIPVSDKLNDTAKETVNVSGVK